MTTADSEMLEHTILDPAYLVAFAVELAPLLLAEVARLRTELAEIQADRVAAQSELLSRRAEQ
jgi:hypothetical protein